MTPQHSGRLSVMLTWMLVFSLLSVCSGIRLSLESSVFVAFSGEDLCIHATLTSPANQTEVDLNCYDPARIKKCNVKIKSVGGAPRTEHQALILKNLSSSGMYSCKVKEVKVHFFVRVRAEGYREPVRTDYTEFITYVLTGVLLLFSVFGTIYVCRGHGETTDGGDMDRKQKQNREDRRKTEILEDHMDMTTAQSTSFYASLEPRPRSIYEVLHFSAARTESHPKKAKSKRNKLSEMVEQDAEHQDEGIFESVYENFQE